MYVTHQPPAARPHRRRTALVLAAAVGLAVPTAGSASAASGEALGWGPPVLVDPVTVVVPDDGQVTHLPTDRDYRLVIEGTVHGTLHVDGGHDVVLVGGTVDSGTSRAAYFQGQTGTLHVQGVRWVSTRAHEGINLAEPRGSTVQFEDLDVGQVNGSYGTHHADVLQTWAGPTRLRVDRLTATTTYQGFFLLPGQHTSDQGPWYVDLRHVVIRGTASAKYLLWVPGSSAFHLSLSNVVAVKSGPGAVPSQTVWSGSPGGVAGVTIASSAASPLLQEPGSSYTAPELVTGLTSSSGTTGTPGSTTTSTPSGTPSGTASSPTTPPPTAGLTTGSATGAAAGTSPAPVAAGSATSTPGSTSSGTTSAGTPTATAGGQGGQQGVVDWLWSWLGQD